MNDRDVQNMILEHLHLLDDWKEEVDRKLAALEARNAELEVKLKLRAGADDG